MYRAAVVPGASAAELLAERGFEADMINAARLHDSADHAPLDPLQIEERFGPTVAALVAGLTEDPRISQYPARKAEARTRAVRDPRVATIYAADKLAISQRFLATGECIDAERLDHYIKTLWLFSDHLPDLPFLPDLSAALTLLIDRDADRVATVPSPIG